MLKESRYHRVPTDISENRHVYRKKLQTNTPINSAFNYIYRFLFQSIWLEKFGGNCTPIYLVLICMGKSGEYSTSVYLGTIW